MNEFMDQLQQNINVVESIAGKIEAGVAYMEDISSYMPVLNQMVTKLLRMEQDPEISLDLNQGFVVQVLNDILYGIEQKDAVFLLDVLRYGLLEIYNYVGSELQSGGEE